MRTLIESGSLRGNSLVYAYTNIRGVIVYTTWRSVKPGVSPQFRLSKGIFRIGWKWKAFSVEKEDISPLWARGWKFHKEDAVEMATDAAIRLWEEWEKSREGRKILR